MALTNDRDTPERDGALVGRPVAASTKLYAGGMGAVDASGNAVAAADTAGLTTVGRIESQVDNSAGSAGDETVTMLRGVFRYANSATNPLSAADIGSNALVEDDETVAKTTTNSIVAGKMIDIDADGVWVEIK